jgi:hypothetical protein
VDNIRVSRAHYSKSEGPTVARALAERHYRNETYVLGIDSHCHFLRGWDNVAIDMFKRLKNDMALITAYPASYSEVDTSRFLVLTLSLSLVVCLQALQGGYGGEDYDVNPLPAIQQSESLPLPSLPHMTLPPVVAICRTRRVNVHTTVSFKVTTHPFPLLPSSPSFHLLSILLSSATPSLPPLCSTT